MKRLMLLSIVSLSIATSQAVSVSDQLKAFELETNKTEQLKAVGAKLTKMIEDVDFIKAVVRWVRLHFNTQEMSLIQEFLPQILKLVELSQDPEFLDQMNRYMQIMQFAQQKGQLTQKDEEDLVALMAKECPLMINFFALSADIQPLQEGVMAGFDAVAWNKVVGAFMDGLKA